MRMRRRVAGIATSVVISAVPTEAQVAPPPNIWNADGRFHLASYDTGELSNVCFINAPWGRRSWGVEASTFSDPSNHRLQTARFIRRYGRAAYLSGLDTKSRWGFVRFVQGDVWGRSHCGPIPWRVPRPLRTSGRQLVLEVDYRRESARLLTPRNSWLMPAVNLWFSSPALPAGGDKTGHKPLVMDLAFGYRCNIPGCKLGSFEDVYAYHYQRFIPYRRFANPARCEQRPAWRCYSIPLNGLIRNALRHDWKPSGPIARARNSLSLYQLDVLIEFHNSRGSASIDNVWLKHRQIDSG